MTRNFTLIVASSMIVAAAAAGGLGFPKRGRVAADPPTSIRAEFRLVDDGTKLTVVGHARGMTPGVTYGSLIYDVGAVAEGPRACAPSIFNPTDPDFILNTMFLGLWKVDKSGRGTLSTINTNGGLDFVPLSKIGAVSVRRLVDGTPTGRTVLEACGALEGAAAKDSDDDSDDKRRDQVRKS